MAKASISTLMPLDQYAEIIGLDPRHFNQVVTDAFPDKTKGSGKIIYQEQWMKPGRASRQEIAVQLANAEALIAQWTRVWPGPKYIVNEVEDFPRGAWGTTMPITQGLCPPGIFGPNRPRVLTDWYQIIQPGQRRTALALEGVPIEYLDEDGDEWPEVAQITIALPPAEPNEELDRITQPNDLGVFPGGWATDPREEDRIRGLTVEFFEDRIEARGPSAWFVRPELWQRNDWINGDDPASFLVTVDIYRISTSYSTGYEAVVFLWQESSLATAWGAQPGVMQVIRPEEGIIALQPATWDEEENHFQVAPFARARPPDSLRLNYVAGLPLDRRGRICSPLDRAVAALATATLTTPLTDGSESIHGIYNYWQEIPDRPTSARRNCPFGERNGAWEAWNTINTFMATLGSSMA